MSIRTWWSTKSKNFANDEEAIIACSKDLGVKPKSVRDSLQRSSTNSLKKSPISSSTDMCSIGLSVDDIRSKYDVLYKIKKAIKEIPEGRFIPEAEFREMFVKCDSSKFRGKADLPEFSDFKGQAKGITYWANPKDIIKLKNEGVLQ